MNASRAPELALFSLTAEVNNQGHLCISGCDVVDPVEEFGTLLYLFDEITIHHKCRELKEESCKSGDILVRDASLAVVQPGDIIAVPVCDAHAISMSSNHNVMPRLAIIIVKAGQAHLIRRRETYQDLMNLDLI
jgi:diaminopimelate decarboxylase